MISLKLETINLIPILIQTYKSLRLERLPAKHHITHKSLTLVTKKDKEK